MKYLKSFEAVIIPSDMGHVELRSFRDAVRYGEMNDFDVVDYDEFYSTLSDRNKKLAPPRYGVPFFALFNPIRNKAMFVVCDENVFRRLPMGQIIKDIIGHERVHAEQAKRKKDITYELPSPTDRKAYFSNKDEVMAFSWSIANSLSKSYRDLKSAISGLSRIDQSEHSRLWSDIKRYCDEDIINRYKKYIYLYLEEILGGDETNKMQNKINNK